MSRLTRSRGRGSGGGGPLTRSQAAPIIPIATTEDDDSEESDDMGEVLEPVPRSSTPTPTSGVRSPQQRRDEDEGGIEEILVDEILDSEDEADSDIELLLSTDDENESRDTSSNRLRATSGPSSSMAIRGPPVLSAVAQRILDDEERIRRADNNDLPEELQIIEDPDPSLNNRSVPMSQESVEADPIRVPVPQVLEVFNRPHSPVMFDVVVRNDGGGDYVDVDTEEDEVEVVPRVVELARPESPTPGPSRVFGTTTLMRSLQDRFGSIRDFRLRRYLSEVTPRPPPNNEDEETESSDQENEDSEGGGDQEENGPPPQKMAKLDTSVRSDDEEGFMCTICYENFTNSGEHRVCCLKCGHVFGKQCIEKWINTQKRCPQCNCKALKRDIRILYVKNLKVMDTAELDRVKKELQNAKEERSRVELSIAHLRAQNDLKTKEILRLKAENMTMLQSRVLAEAKEVIDVEPGSASASQSTDRIMFSSLRMPKFQPIKHFDIKEGNARVGAYNEWMNLLVGSHGITNALFPSGCYGIKKINSLDMKAFQSFPVHQRALRDMEFSQGRNDLLLTVGLDKKAVLFNCNSNCAVQTFQSESPLWSCCWNTVNHNIFYVGNVTGKVTSYDIRAPQEPLNTLEVPAACKQAAARLKFVPPAYQNQAFNMSGLLIQKLNSMWFCEMLGGDDGDPRYHQLPLEGPFLTADFEPSSRHVLVSSRPKVNANTRIGASHVVCSLGKVYSEIEERDVFSCEVVQTIFGGFQEASILCRSALFSPQPDKVYVAANGEGIRTVRLWDVANVEQKCLVRIKENAALDFVPGKVNDTNFLGIITDKSLDIYGVK